MLVQSGGCICGKIRYTYNAEPITKVLCHCDDCRKISGSNYSVNFLVPEAAFQVTVGTPKIFSKVADSGDTINSYFCGDCGSMIWRESTNCGPNKVVKAGTLDDSGKIISTSVFDAEVFTRSRVEWVQPIAGASQRVAA
ncbi:CENP-V/GFA domain-containing protein [Trichoderma simmonsii]|uniref:CENP-V/GFA domain-containing protein n=1 Tax=Trichoderma simmonsii TaxID=1491479 RepID=A0A8G0PG73_9HYPO|nr:CENP-V/GFA domain-containing protein [Trichoderma simmonsii]